MEKFIKNSNYEKVFDYFMILGLNSDNLKGDKNLTELKNMKPEIISVYPECDENVPNNKLQTIFPEKVDYIENLNFDNLEFEKGFYEDYIIYTTERPKEFYHCFSSKFLPEDLCYTWHFGVLIFYEEILIKTSQIEGGKYYYAAKAILLCSKKAYYVLFKKILEEIYSNYLESVEQPLELMIINFYQNLSFEKNTPQLIKFFDFEYFIPGETFLPDYDLNLISFFNKFSLLDFLVIAEQFLKRMPILIFSENVTNLYPFYFTFLNLINPLDITNLNDYYIFLSNSVLSNVLLSSLATWVSINSKIISDEILKQIVEEKGLDTLVINLDNFEIKLFEIETSKIIKIDSSYKNSVINYIFTKNIIQEINLLNLIENDIKILKKIIIEDKSTILSNYFFYLHPNKYIKENSLINRIRKQFFSLFSKLLSFNIPYTEIEIINKNEQIKNQIEINFERKLNDPILADFFSYFKSTPSFNIVFKYKCNSKDSNLVNLILLDELIKILKIDENRLYFDKCLSLCETIPENIDTININENNLFLNIGDYHNSLHVYNLNLLRNKIYDYKLDDIGGEKYLIKYKFLNLFFNKFDYFISQNKIYQKLKFLSDLTYKNEEINVLIYEIKAFVHLIKTGTLFIENLKLITLSIVIVILSVEILSTGKSKYEKFDRIYQLFKNTNFLDNKFSFINSLIYEIIYKDKILRNKYELDFLVMIKKLKIIPTFNIYIRANDDKKENQIEIINRNYNLNHINEPVLIFDDLKCINECQMENIKEMIGHSNMTSLKCSKCNEEGFLDLYSLYELFGNLETKLKHPIQILISLLNEIINNGKLELDIKSLESLIDPISKEDFRLILFYIKVYQIELENSMIFQI